MQKKKSIEEKFLFIPNDSNLDKYNHNSFILPLKDYSVGFDIYFNISQINELSNKYNIYVIINKFLHTEDINKIKKIINNISDKINGYFIEDYGLANIIDNDKIILYPNHIINNYRAINYLFDKGLKNIVISNELTIKELKEIRSKSKSKLYYNLICKNMIMYSKRELISNYYKNFRIESNKKILNLNECLKNKKVIIKEENNSSVIYNYETFCGNKYLKDLLKNDYLIINYTLLNEEETKMIINNYSTTKLYKQIECDYYFLENEIKYKVKDL